MEEDLLQWSGFWCFLNPNTSFFQEKRFDNKKGKINFHTIKMFPCLRLQSGCSFKLFHIEHRCCWMVVECNRVMQLLNGLLSYVWSLICKFSHWLYVKKKNKKKTKHPGDIPSRTSGTYKRDEIGVNFPSLNLNNWLHFSLRVVFFSFEMC